MKESLKDFGYVLLMGLILVLAAVFAIFMWRGCAQFMLS